MNPSNRPPRGHGEELRRVAAALGLAYEEGPATVYRQLCPGAPLFEYGVLCANRLSGTIDGTAAAMFDLTTMEGTSEDATRRTWTVILFAECRLPEFVCLPRRWATRAERAMLTPISFDTRAAGQRTRQAVADFEKACILGVSETAASSGEDPIRRHFCAPRLEALVQSPNWYVQSADGLLVFARTGMVPAADRPALWHEARELRQALLAPLAPDVSPIPPLPRMDVGRQRSRRAGRRAGALAGAVAGLFLSFLAGGALLFMSRRMGPRGAGISPAFVFALAGIVLGGLLIGTLAGWWLGGLWADLRSGPIPGGDPQPMGRASQ